MEEKNETITFVDRLNDIVKRIDLTNKLDMNKLPDLEQAKEYIEGLKNDFKRLCEDSPFVHNMTSFFGRVANIDVRNELETIGKKIDEKIKEIKSDLKAAEIVKTECDCSGCDDCEEDAFDYCDCDVCTLDDNNITGMDVYRELDDDVIDGMKSTKSQAESITNLIANYLNENHGYLDYNDEDDVEELHYLCNTLFEFADYVWHK